MRRSLLEFKSLMPDVDMIANPVFPDNVKIDSWWRYPGSAALIASEYNKYLFASLRNSVLDLLPESNRLALNIRSDTEVNAQDDATSNGIPRIGG